MNTSALWYLEGMDLFGKLCMVKSQQMDAQHQSHRFDAGEYIYMPNDSAKSLYIIESGRVKVAYYNNDGVEVTKSLLREGEVFGEIILAGEQTRTDFAQSMENNTRICAIEWQSFQQMMREDANLSLRVVKWMGFRLNKMERKIEALIFKDARERIVEFLLDAAAFKGKQVGTEWMIKTKLTHSDIAALTATSRQTVSEVLNDLRREDQIYFERGKILIRDISKIK
jgi:CRP-like cAMP-binding protein